MATFNLSIKKNQAETDDVSISGGEVVFVLGANGSGKSSLMLNFSRQHQQALRILAHRQSWLNSSISELTPSSRVQYDRTPNEHSPVNRYKDLSKETFGKLLIYDIINSENIRARNITEELTTGDPSKAKEMADNIGVVKQINALLSSCNLPIVISIGSNDALMASKNGNAPFAIEKLSDGERNAFIISASVLLTKQGSLILLDEPEKHLHRSIISPLLSALLIARNDCAFVISTHDIQLAADHSGYPVILTRDVIVDSNNEYWDFDILENSSDIPGDLKLDILGAKRKILFVEGESQSLDKSLYQLIYPETTVIARGTCSQVERAVEGINSTDGLHHIRAYGLIDADDRTTEQISNLEEKGIIALPLYSVEAIYYHPKMIKYVAEKFGAFQQQDSQPMIELAINSAKHAISQHKERLCSRLCEKNIRQMMFSNLPNHIDILSGRLVNVQINVTDLLSAEKDHFDSLVEKPDITELISRYPIRETPAITKIVEALGLRRSQYENIVRALVSEDPNVITFLRTELLAALTSLIER